MNPMTAHCDGAHWSATLSGRAQWPQPRQSESNTGSLVILSWNFQVNRKIELHLSSGFLLAIICNKNPSGFGEILCLGHASFVVDGAHEGGSVGIGQLWSDESGCACVPVNAADKVRSEVAKGPSEYGIRGG